MVIDDAHLVERDAVEEGARVVDRVDRHTGHADVAAHARVVGVVAAVGRQVEGDAQALLPGGEVAAVERVGLLGGGEAGVLPDRPRLGGVHRRVGAAQERRDARLGVQRRRGPRGARVRRPAGCRCPPGSSTARATSGRAESRRPDLDSARSDPVPRRRSSSECSSAELLSDPGEERQRVDAHGARVVDAAHGPLPRLARRARRTTRLPHAARRPGRHPTRRTPRRCRRGTRRAARRRPPCTASTPSVAPAASTATPPAANRLVAKVARAVCAATGAHRREEDRPGAPASSRMRLEGDAVALDTAAPGHGCALGQRLAEVRELARCRSAGGDRSAMPSRRRAATSLTRSFTPTAASRRSRRRPRSGRAPPTRRRRGRR